jgi:cbb3-type cytochrome oxidase maturation protein
MEILYLLVYISLGISIAFLFIFFWAVNTDQLSSLDSASWTILEDNNINNHKQTEEK